MPLEPDGVREHVFVKIEPLDEERAAIVKVEPGCEAAAVGARGPGEREPRELVRVKTEPCDDAVLVKTEPGDDAVLAKTEPAERGGDQVRCKLEAGDDGSLQPAGATTFEVPITDAARIWEPSSPGGTDTTVPSVRPAAGRYFECDSCGKRCSTKENLRNHIFSHPHMRRACPTCKKLVSRRYLRRHVAAHAADTRHVAARRWACARARCGAVFRARAALAAHAAAGCGDVLEQAEPARPAGLAGRRRHACALCPQTFLTRQNAKRHHERVHTDTLPHQCPVCHKRFKYSSSFHDHKLTHAEKRYECEICHKRFALKAYLAEHAHVHTGEKGEYRCDKCPFTFRSRYKLGRHELTHTGLKPFTCDICRRSFTTAFWLRRHVEAHAGNPEHECADCGKRFTQKANLVDHRKQHTGEGYPCGVCGERFATRGRMRQHKRAHGAPQLACGKCGKGFVRPCLLAQHERRHAQQEKELVNVPQQQEKKHAGVKQQLEKGHVGVTQQQENEHVGVTQQQEKGHVGVTQQQEKKHAGVTQQQEKKHAGVTQQQKNGHVGVSVTRPEKRHAGVPASTCRVCGKAFPLASALRRHVDTWHKDVSGPDAAQTNASNS